MRCTNCSSDIMEDCHYCPVCGKPTPLSAEASAARLASNTDPAGTAASGASTVMQGQSAEAGREAASAAAPSPLLLESAAPVFTPPAALDPKTIHTLLAQANLYRLRRQWEEATEQCIGILRSDPGNQAAHSLLGDIYRDQGKGDDAIRWYQMAVDLQPNAADEAKLHKMEQAQAKQLALAERQQRAGVAPGTGELATDGGTTYLMNMSPRRWLRGITVASVVFLIVMLGVLFQMHATRRNADIVPHALGGDGVTLTAASGNPSDPLPPARLGGGAVMPSGASSGGSSNAPYVGGSGLPPDLHSSGSPSTPISTGTVTEAPKPTYQTHTDLPTAAVTGVRPMAGDVGGSVAISSSGNALTGGMTMGMIHDESNDGTVSVTVLAQDVSGSGMRDHAIRNIIRAARTAFNNNSRLSHAVVTIQTSANASEAHILMRADVDRSAIASINPDEGSLDSLERLIQVR
ncbi:MAG TPA: hypothetical protein VKU00_32915 [Chthonomonadaceae bacterium]|nr:hypothetical protein [Chthonomonadaceae bacterium]